MEKLKMFTSNLAKDNIEKIKQIFPSCITEHIGVGGEQVLLLILISCDKNSPAT